MSEYQYYGWQALDRPLNSAMSLRGRLLRQAQYGACSCPKQSACAKPGIALPPKPVLSLSKGAKAAARNDG